ncbi:MAG: choice-of-anchor J domain-containing protein, partial [Bacteroidales bacterium]|nr:choice-of-anchor J domain-containing protein [Bacteroidales bacterium]
MKKLFTLMFALFAMVAMQAQSLLSEDFENGIPETWTTIDADGDGYGWSCMAMPGHDASTDCATSQSYDNNAGALTPDNWLITPATNLTSNSTLTFWVCAQDASYPTEHYGVYISTTGTDPANFTLLYEEDLDANGGQRVQGAWKQKTVDLSSYTGQTVYIAFRHFDCTDAFYINIDDVEIFEQPTDPTIVANPATLDFGIVLVGNSNVKQVAVTSYNITNNITATTTAPYEVSADNTTYASTATIPAAGGTLYVRFSPTAEGTDNGTVVLASDGAEDYTITLTGTAIDCSTNGTVPFTETFDNYEGELPMCYTFVYADEDPDVNTIINYNESGDNYVIRFSSYSRTDSAGQYMISPELVYSGTADMEVSFIAKAYSSSYPETFRIGYSTTTNDVNAFTWGEQYTASTTFDPYSMVIPANAKYAAIHYMSDDKWYLYVDDFAVNEATSGIRVNVDTVDFGVVYLGDEKTELVNVVGVILENNIAAGVTAPFAISVDDSIYDVTASLAVEGGNLYVKFAPVAEGDFSATITLTSGELSNEVFV